MTDGQIVTNGEPIEIRRSLVLSTGHLREETDEAMREDKAHPLVCNVSFSHTNYGHQVFVSDDTFEDGVPDEILKAFEVAKRHNCTYIEYDADGPFIEGLTAWDW